MKKEKFVIKITFCTEGNIHKCKNWFYHISILLIFIAKILSFLFNIISDDF